MDSNPGVSSHRRRVYICHVAHENDRTIAENVSQFCAEHQVDCTSIELRDDGVRPELLNCLEGDAFCVLGFNSQLDHSWIESDPFLRVAEAQHVPVIQWLVDHPSCLWRDFNFSTPTNSRYLFHSPHSEHYFRRYCLPQAITGNLMCFGPNWRSRVNDLNKDQFLGRIISCLIPLNLARIGGDPRQLQQRIAAFDPRLCKVIEEATLLGHHDLERPVECHLNDVLNGLSLTISEDEFHQCAQAIEESIQVYRRLHVFRIAQEFPVFIQSDEQARPYVQGKAVRFEANVGMRETISRMTRARAIVSITHLNDMIHDRVLNGINAGCLLIVEANLIHKTVFEDRTNALLFTYEHDDSLRECLNLACHKSEEAYRIAGAGIALRDTSPFRFGNFSSIFTCANTLDVNDSALAPRSGQTAANS